MTDHQKLVCALLGVDDDAKNHPTTLEVMARLSGAAGDCRRSSSKRPLATPVALAGHR